jgi:hypothetical protein
MGILAFSPNQSMKLFSDCERWMPPDNASYVYWFISFKNSSEQGKSRDNFAECCSRSLAANYQLLKAGAQLCSVQSHYSFKRFLCRSVGRTLLSTAKRSLDYFGRSTRHAVDDKKNWLISLGLCAGESSRACSRCIIRGMAAAKSDSQFNPSSRTIWEAFAKMMPNRQLKP